MTKASSRCSLPKPYRPSPGEVDDLLRQAAGQPRGTDFLRTGALDSVAATFGVHAFVVDAARRALPTPDAAGASPSAPTAIR